MTHDELSAKTVPIETLRQLFDYKPETGELFWRVRSPEMFFRAQDWKGWNGRYAGKLAFTTSGEKGRLQGGIFNTTFSAHRVIWALHYGEWPDQIDHINGNAGDNRIVNLRDVNNRENMKNKPLRCDNRSGCHGVYWHERSKTWEVKINAGGKNISLGRFTVRGDAIAARKAAEIEHGYHPNHGRPA